MKTTRFVKYVILLGSFGCLPGTARAAEIITNGGFQGNFAGWTRVDAPGSDGTFSLQTGSLSPVNGTAVPASPGPPNAAMTDAQGPGSHVLYQDFILSAATPSAILSFDFFVGNSAGAFFVPSPASLDFGIAAFNQQARVDILLGSASVFSVASSDVLLNVYQTSAGNAAASGYAVHSGDVSAILNAHLNTPLRLRFAETDNVSTFQFGVDNVSLLTGPAVNPVPEPTSLLMLGLGGLLSIAAVRLRKRFGWQT